MRLFEQNKHPVVHFPKGDFIVDTGSPVSFNYLDIPEIEIDGRKYPFSQIVACPKETADALTGGDIAGFIGIDILKKTGLTIDYENKTLDFSCDTDENDSENAASLSFDYFMGTYMVTSDVAAGRRLKNAIIDTGAPVSYISARLTNLFEPTGESYEDFSPEYGVLRGEYRKGTLELNTGSGKRTRSVMLGMMPQLIDMFGVFDAILGISTLTDKRIMFDFNNRTIRVEL